jgi:prephenate dehydrogenase
MKKVLFNHVAILGVGLIGASFALALKKNKLCNEITGFGRNKDNLRKARERGIIDRYETEPGAACNGADLILFATPVGSFLNLAARAKPSFMKGALITDVGSVKGSLVYEMEKTLPEDVVFIGAHPIAGNDRSGIDASQAELFENTYCIVTPTEHSDAQATEKIIDLWTAMGAHTIIVPPLRHDIMYGAVSHLPHIIAYTLMNTSAEIDRSSLKFCGQGFIDTTRIAGSSPELWRDICLLNKDNLLEMIESFQKKLALIGQYLRASDADSLEGEFKKARTLREGIGQD